jgi:hypothetical protein
VGPRRKVVVAAVFAALTTRGADARAFIFPEHSLMTQAVFEDLAQDRDIGLLLRSFWQSPELCVQKGDMNEGDCLRLVADLVAIAADHSCSPAELEELVSASNLEADHWLWDVRRNAWEGDAWLNGDRAENRRRHKVLDFATIGVAEANATIYRKDRVGVEEAEDRAFYRRRVNLGMQDVDDGYQSRAIVDAGHFQLTRDPGRLDLVTYLRQVFAPTAETNATALYATYHGLALRFAAAGDSPFLRKEAFLSELFALHFLEDSFSSGHIVGHRGVDTWLPLKSEGVRMGTHDHYSDEGVEVARWNDLASPYIAHGDGTMKPVDSASAGVAVTASLREVLEAMQDRAKASSRAAAYASLPSGLGSGFDSCRELHPIKGLEAIAVEHGPVNDIVANEPVPSPRTPEPPRFRAEAGLFFGGSAGLDGGTATNEGAVGRAHAAIRGGVGLNGLTVDPINSIAFGEIGIVALGTHIGSHASADAGISVRLRSPGLVTLVEGTMILGALALGARPTWLIDLGAKAGGGGLVPFIWQSHHIAGPWNFQVSALRDASFNYYFRSGEHYRWELQAPAITLRTANPNAGVDWAQSNDFWMDLGFSGGRASEAPHGSFGFYLSLSASARSFP